MNKSKFLKKSLAALLAVMLVVAMIPLSAAAASADVLPALTRIYVDGKEITANGTAFSANFAEDQAESTIAVRATLPAGTQLQAFTSETSLTPEATITGSDSTLTVKKFTNGATEGTVYLKLSPSDPSDGRAPVWYTLNLKQVTLSDDSGVKGVSITSAGKDNGLLNATVDQDNLTINVEAAYGYGAAGTIQVEPTDGASVENSGTITVADGTQFTVTAGGINTEWTIKVTEVEALLDFTVAGKQGTIDHDAKTITVNLTMDDIKDQYGDLLGDDPQLVIDYSTITNTAVAIHTSSSTTFSDGTAFDSGTKQTLDDLGTATLKSEKYILVRNGSASNAQPYKLTVQIPKNTDTTISYAAIGGVEATIDGTNISAVLNANTPNAAQTLRLHVPKGATVTPGTTSATANWDVDTAESTEYDVWTTASTDGSATDADAAKTSATPDTKKTFVVTAADDSYSTQYSIWWTKASGQTEAALKSLNLKNGDDVYTGTVDESAKSVTIEVPYMTTSMEGWKIFATYSDGAIGTYNGASIMSGITPVDAAVNMDTTTTDGTTQTIADFITVNSQGTTAVETKYALVVKFKAPNNNKLLTGLKVTAQNPYVTGTSGSTKTEKVIARAMDDKNTYDATVTAPTFSSSGVTDKLGSVKIETAFSQKQGTLGYVMPIVDITTNGGIPYLCSISAGGGINVYKTKALDESSDTDFALTNAGAGSWNNMYLIHSTAGWGFGVNDTFAAANSNTDGYHTMYFAILPEEVAKKYVATIDTANVAAITSDDAAYCSFYKVNLTNKAANTQGKLESLTIAGQTMRITTGSSGAGTIIGTIPFSATVDAFDTVTGGNNSDNAQFLEFKLSDYANLGENGTAISATNKFTSGGDTDGDGEANDIAGDNKKLLFVRDTTTDHGVKIYALNADTTTVPSVTTDIGVYAEANSTSTATNVYNFQLKYADACKEADITSFDLSGNKGSISGTTINVSVPKGTNLKALRATFETSIGAKVYLNEGKTEEIKSGKTVLNCSSDVKLYVLSEDGSKTEVYTVKVTEGEMFVDVNRSDWFYGEVNTAAQNGWINGTGDGYFTPYGNMTRGQFALIIARMDESFDEEADVDCPFPDVNSTAYKAAAKYVYDKGWMQGDGNNFFNADDNITRAQAAIVLCKMNSIEPISGNTTYADDASIADWAKGYVKAATAANIFKGEGDDFNPQRALRRCEGAAILVRSASK